MAAPQTGEELMRERFPAFLALAKADGYCGPFVPYVGPRYPTSELKIVYCGVAPYYDDDSPFNAPADAAEWSRSVAEEADIGSPFWRLLDDILGLRYAEKPLERRQRAVWTNLSKLNWGGRITAPADGEQALRRLNVAQFKDEMALLGPNLLVCVSGSGLVETGRELFEPLDRGAFMPSVDQTWVRKLPTGGTLYWTMHPGHKSTDWKNRVIGDVAKLIASCAA